MLVLTYKIFVLWRPLGFYIEQLMRLFVRGLKEILFLWEAVTQGN